MKMAAASVFSALRAEFEAAQKGLKDVDENIKRLTGRDPDEFRAQLRRPGGPMLGGPPDQQGRERFSGKPEVKGGPPTTKRRNFGGPFVRPPIELPPAEESGDEEDLPRKGGVQSWVVAAPTKETQRTRKEASADQKGDRRCMERNKRMFGIMLGTLQKFQSEETRRKDQLQSQKRAEIEQKLEEAAEREKAQLRKERQDLFLSRRQKQQSLRRLELKMEVARLHEEAEARQRLLLNFIHTRTKPHIMFKPAKPCPETQKRLKESQKRILGTIESRRAKVKEELDAIDELYRRGGGPPVEEEEEESHKENRGPPATETSAAEASTDDPGHRVKPEGENAATDSEAVAPGDVAAATDAAEPMEVGGEETAGQQTAAEGPATQGTADEEGDRTDAEATVNVENGDAVPETASDKDAAEAEAAAEVAAEIAPAMDVLGDEKFEPIYDE
uniref:Pinin n=1 Tax=Ixodes ricinus TaxID=34613 RepID=A0A6B0VCK9_IXORI